MALRFGVKRLILANVIVRPDDIEWLADANMEPGVSITTYIDSAECLDIFATILASSQASRPVPVLLEIGHFNGRTGIRDATDAVKLGRAIRSTHNLELVGTAGFEGTVAASRSSESLALVRQFLTTIGTVHQTLFEEGLLPGAEGIVTAGGSAYLDVVTEMLAPVAVSTNSSLVLRSGCYLTHDHGAYSELGPFGRTIEGEPLKPALELWSTAISRPEKDLAILDFGRRDASYDSALPRVLARSPRGARNLVPIRAEVASLNDQHAYVRLHKDAVIEVGDRLMLGISHPCTTFEKWAMLPLVDDNQTVVDIVHTLFR